MSCDIGSSRGGGVPNAVSIDVEDWPQSVLDHDLPLTDRFYSNTHKVLEMLARHATRATFFVLGLAAERAPQLVRDILSAGHEIQSHGYGHRLIHELTPAQLRADLDRSKKLLEDLAGQEVSGYRAPGFSITQRTLWALDVLVEVGFRYDSSIFPVLTRRYGIRGAPDYPHRLGTPSGGEVYEFPVATCRLAGRRLPVGGGGYFRLFPYFILRRGVQQLNRRGHPATIYLHPYEFSPRELAELDLPVSWKMRLHQGLWRARVPMRADRLLDEFRFGPIRDLLDRAADWPKYRHR